MLNDSQIAFASIGAIGKLFRSRKLSPVELTRFLLARIEGMNPKLNAFLTITADLALKQAARATDELAKGRSRSPRRDRGPLHGIPVSLKDNIYTAGIRTTAGSKILREFVPRQNADVVTALFEAGVVLLGKTNMHEFAYGASNINPHYGVTRNPWDWERIPGGSSGGSAAALAAGLGYGSIGSDTGGSIRIPSSLCGTVGLKPTFGLVSTEGVVPLAPSLDVVGPLARSVGDTALLYQAMLRASRSRTLQRSAKSAASRARKPRLGIPKEFFFDILAPDVADAFHRAIRLLRRNGATVKKVSLPLVEVTESAGNQIAWAEALLYHQESGWYPARAEEYGEDVRLRLEMGSKVSAVAYLQAVKSRERFISKFHALFDEQELDALVVPTTPITAPRIDEETISIGGTSHPSRALLLRLNRPANLAGIPAISVPSGQKEGELPVGVQFMGPVGSEPFLFAMGAAFERLSRRATRVPIRPPDASNR